MTNAGLGLEVIFVAASSLETYQKDSESPERPKVWLLGEVDVDPTLTFSVW